jgi:PAS domain S-box-containing protein
VYEYVSESDTIRWVGAVETLTGYSATELTVLGLNAWMQVIHRDDQQRVRQTLEHCLLTHQPYTLDYRLIHKEGSIVPVLDRGRLLIDTESQAPHLVGALLNLTAIRQQEAALRRSEERYRIIATQVGAVIVEHELHTNLSQVHGPIEAMLGYSKDVSEQMPGIDSAMIHPNDRDRVIAIQQTAERNLSSYYVEYRCRHNDGHYADIAARGIYLRGTDGKAERAVVAITDITERKRAEQKLQENQLRFRAAAEQAGQVVYEWTLDEHGQILDLRFDGAFEQMFGYDAVEVRQILLHSRFALVHPDDLPLFNGADTTSGNSSDHYQIEHRQRHRDGHYIYVENRGIVRHDAAHFCTQKC